MADFEPKKLALLRILQIFRQYSDYDHPLKQEEIAAYLERDYGITVERKAISRNISLLREAGMDIVSGRSGSYLESREFEDSEIRLLIDGVLSSRHITAKYSKELIEKLCGLSSSYFRSHVKNIYSVNDWSKTENKALFFNIEMIDEAIERKKQITFIYNKYGADKKLHRTANHAVTPYQLILHSQRYYLIARNERWHNIGHYRLDRITDMRLSEKPATPINTIKGFENGIDYRVYASSLPYMFTDKPERIEFIADESIADQIVDWFGYDAKIEPGADGLRVTVTASPMAMEFWLLQYSRYTEVVSPAALREKIIDDLKKASERYTKT